MVDGLVKGSVLQRANITLGRQGEAFNSDTLLQYALASGAGRALASGLDRTGKLLLKDNPARIDSAGFDVFHALTSVTGNLTMNWTLNGFSSDRSQAGTIEALQYLVADVGGRMAYHGARQRGRNERQTGIAAMAKSKAAFKGVRQSLETENHMTREIDGQSKTVRRMEAIAIRERERIENVRNLKHLEHLEQLERLRNLDI